jgi:hypothetical protein
LPIPPGEDGTGRATWREVLGEPVSYWQADDSRDAAGTGGMTDPQFDTLMGELSKNKQMLRQLRHG